MVSELAKWAALTAAAALWLSPGLVTPWQLLALVLTVWVLSNGLSVLGLLRWRQGEEQRSAPRRLATAALVAASLSLCSALVMALGALYLAGIVTARPSFTNNMVPVTSVAWLAYLLWTLAMLAVLLVALRSVIETSRLAVVWGLFTGAIALYLLSLAMGGGEVLLPAGLAAHAAGIVQLWRLIRRVKTHKGLEQVFA